MCIGTRSHDPECDDNSEETHNVEDQDHSLCETISLDKNLVSPLHDRSIPMIGNRDAKTVLKEMQNTVVDMDNKVPCHRL